jgi:hypothetical protein
LPPLSGSADRFSIKEDAMSKKDLPSVPPAGRSNKGPNAAKDGEERSDLAADQGEPRHRNTEKQGREGNIAADTRNQRYQ